MVSEYEQPPMPPCEVCGGKPMAAINGKGMCADPEHIEAVMDMVLDPINQARERWGW